MRLDDLIDAPEVRRELEVAMGEPGHFFVAARRVVRPHPVPASTLTWVHTWSDGSLTVPGIGPVGGRPSGGGPRGKVIRDLTFQGGYSHAYCLPDEVRATRRRGGPSRRLIRLRRRLIALFNPADAWSPAGGSAPGRRRGSISWRCEGGEPQLRGRAARGYGVSSPRPRSARRARGA